MRSRVFLQFLLIFLISLCVILLSSTSFYTNIITGITLSNLRDAVDRTKYIDVSENGDVIQYVENIETDLSVFIEVYGKNPGDPNGVYTKPIYNKYSCDQYLNLNSNEKNTNSSSSFVGFADGEFKVDRDYADGSAVGKLTNSENSYEFYVLAAPSISGAYQVVAAVQYSTIEQLSLIHI